MTKLALTILYASTLLLVSSTSADAAFDHLKCFKIKDTSNYTAFADLVTNPAQQGPFPNEDGCKILVRSKEFCVPVEKNRIFQTENPRDAPHLDIEGHDVQQDYLCYKMRCPKKGNPEFPQLAQEQMVADQFGLRTISGFKTHKICTPTRKVNVPQFKDPATQSAVTRTTFSTTSLTGTITIFTSVESEFLVTGVAGYAAPAGIEIVGVSEDIGARNCAGGVPTMGPSVGCEQQWVVNFRIADEEVCELDGDYEVEFTIGCNENMDHCMFVDPTEENFTEMMVLASDSFCPLVE